MAFCSCVCMQVSSSGLGLLLGLLLVFLGIERRRQEGPQLLVLYIWGLQQPLLNKWQSRHLVHRQTETQQFLCALGSLGPIYPIHKWCTERDRKNQGRRRLFLSKTQPLAGCKIMNIQMAGSVAGYNLGNTNYTKDESMQRRGLLLRTFLMPEAVRCAVTLNSAVSSPVFSAIPQEKHVQIDKYICRCMHEPKHPIFLKASYI